MSLVRRFVRSNRKASRYLERRFPRFFFSDSYELELRSRIEEDLERIDGRVLEVGGIDRALLDRNQGFGYDGMDIDEKPTCYEIYDNFLVQSIEEPVKREYELIISMTLLEHVRNNRAAFNSIFEALVPGGSTHHYLPSRNHPYALCLRLVGPHLQKILIRILRPHSVEGTGYPAYFDHCTPKGMRALLAEIGFSEIDVRPYYRANDYFAFFVPVFLLVSAFENLCRRLGWCYFASGFVLSARRPESPEPRD